MVSRSVLPGAGTMFPSKMPAELGSLAGISIKRTSSPPSRCLPAARAICPNARSLELRTMYSEFPVRQVVVALVYWRQPARAISRYQKREHSRLLFYAASWSSPSAVSSSGMTQSRRPRARASMADSESAQDGRPSGPIRPAHRCGNEQCMGLAVGRVAEPIDAKGIEAEGPQKRGTKRRRNG